MPVSSGGPSGLGPTGSNVVSTGFGPSGATAHDVELMRLTVGPDMGVKASGGIRTLDDVKKMAAAGATRIGASASVKIVEATTGAPQTASSGY